MDQNRLKASGGKRGRAERSENITQRENSRAKREKKGVVRISDWRVRKVVDQQSAFMHRLMSIVYVVVKP